MNTPPSTWTVSILMGALLATAAGCTQGTESATPVEDTGRVALSIASAPEDALCLRITVKGATTAVRSLGLMPGQSTRFMLEGLPVGAATFTAEAFAAACGTLSPETTASYVSDAVAVMLVDGRPIEVAIALRRPGRANVTVDFPGDAGVPDMPPMGGPNGSACSANGQCASGFCVEGVCCSSSCSGTCQSCRVMGSLGSCRPSPAGLRDMRCMQAPATTCGTDGTCDGAGACRRYAAGTECAPGTCMGATEFSARICDGAGTCLPPVSRSCAPNMCAGNSCGASCMTSADCQIGFVCEAGRCVARKANGSACAASAECASGFCANGLCCNTACTGACQACNLMGSAGTCTSVPAGVLDPSGQCRPEPVTTCGTDGRCDGAGGCRRYASGTVCAPARCSDGVRQPPSVCDGAGACRVPPPQSCAPLSCSGTECGTSCMTSAQCPTGFVCTAGLCRAAAGPVLYWRFDELMGTTAVDSSNNGFGGTYVGATGTPEVSTANPGGMNNPRSRLFTAASRHAVQLAATPALLKPANGLTVSAWFRATSVDSSGAEIVSAGDNYVLRVRAGAVEFSKRIAGAFAQCLGMSAGHLDGNWHHLVGVSSPAGMKVYLDGIERCTNTRGENLVYDRGPDFWVGRHGNGQTTWDFGGNIDDVRVYPRALTAAEISSLVPGVP